MTAEEFLRAQKKTGRIKGTRRATRGDLKFDSEREAAYYDELVLRQKAGDIEFFLRQPSFDLPGGIKYRADFLIVPKGVVLPVVDVKGHRTEVYLLKKKQVESLYPIEILEV